MRPCSYDKCDNETKNKQYCSKSCANAAAPKRRRKCSDGVSVCTVATCDCQSRRAVKSKKCVVCPTVFDIPPGRGNAGKRFCSPRCQGLHQHGVPDLVERWLAGEDVASAPAGKDLSGNDKKNLASWARNYLLEEAGWKCTKCGWDTPHPLTGKPPLEIDHIDGNRRNNSRENLVVLCPNDHALTPTYRRYNYKHVQELKRTEWLDN